MKSAYLAVSAIQGRSKRFRCIPGEIVVRIVVTNLKHLELPRWPQISSPLSNAKTVLAMAQASENSTMEAAFISGFIEMAGSIGGCGIGRLEAKNLFPLGSFPRSRWAMRGKSVKTCASSWKLISTHPPSAGPQTSARSALPRALSRRWLWSGTTNNCIPGCRTTPKM